jgi:hypothetical protein
VFSRCVFCHGKFTANDSVERFPVGKRLAFDPGRGRLWAVCGRCRRWTLAPIEERWEALEELERLVIDRGKLLSQTENIAFVRAQDVEVVRVGRANLSEEAWWRYGRELRDRRRHANIYRSIELGALIAIMFATGGFGAGIGDIIMTIARWRRFGSIAWRGAEPCVSCGHVLRELDFSLSCKLSVVLGADGTIALQMKCNRCAKGQHVVGDLAAEHTLRRMLAYRHFSGASEKRVIAATRTIEAAGSAHQLTRELAARNTTFMDLEHKSGRTSAIALEIALNDETERQLLELELKELEAAGVRRRTSRRSSMAS